MPVFILSLFIATSPFISAFAQESYIDHLRKEIREKDEEEGRPSDQESYTEVLRDEIQARDQEEIEDGDRLDYSNESYIERLKREDPERFKKKEGPFLDKARDQVRKKDREAAEEDEGDEYRPAVDSAIGAVRTGKSELELKRRGKIRQALGFKLGTMTEKNIRAANGGTGRSFEEVYGTKWNLDLSIFYEYQLFHSENWGSIGLVAAGGVMYYTGKGKFRFILSDEKTGESFGANARTRFHFTAVPLRAGVNYRLNFARLIRPFVEATPSVIPYQESRSDENPTNRGLSTAVSFTGGAAILLDWLSRESAWNYYDSYGVKHYYLTVEYTRMLPIAGDVEFDVSGVYAGFTFEY